MDETTPLPGGPSRRILADRYELRGLLGQGGMADVELAFDQALDRHVAIKLLHQRYTADPQFIARFRREAQSVAGLNHPNIVAVYDTGEHESRPFIVMEYVSGRSLAEVLANEGVLPERAAEIAAEAAAALHYAHDRGLVHRDVKPGNILLSDDGRVKVTDFGIARAVSAETVTQTAAVFGTAAYIAPEQAQGSGVDARTDVYALGCVLYEMLTGRQPFAGDSAVALAYKHVSEAPLPPRQLNPEVPPELEAVVLQAMAKEPDLRYQSARQFQADLQRALHGVPIAAAPPTEVYEATEALPRTAVIPPTARRDDDYYYYPEEEQRRSALPWILFGVALLAALVAVGLFLAGAFEREPEVLDVAVPNVVGREITEAQALLREDGFEPELQAQETTDVEADHVIGTDPPAGALAPEGSTVVVIYSAGAPLVVVPAISRLPEEQAQALLVERGLALGTRFAEQSDDVAEGFVIRTDPPAGQEVPEGTLVDIYVSAGEPTYALPDVRNRTETEARAELENFCGDPPCVRVQVAEEQYHPTIPAGSVINTNPPPGSEVTRGDRVGLVLSRGPEPEPIPPITPSPTPPPEETPTPTPTEEPEPPIINPDDTNTRRSRP